MSIDDSWIVLAHILRPQGRKGEVLAEVLTDFPESFTTRSNLFLIPGEMEDSTNHALPTTVSSVWRPVGKNRGKIVLQLKGSTSISEAESLAGLNLAVQSKDRLPLESESVYVGDLVGCTIFNRQNAVGEIIGVQFPSATDGSRIENAPSLLEVRSIAGDEVLIPFAKDFFISLDMDHKKLVLHLPEGLVEINR